MTRREFNKIAKHIDEYRGKWITYMRYWPSYDKYFPSLGTIWEIGTDHLKDNIITRAGGCVHYKRAKLIGG